MAGVALAETRPVELNVAVQAISLLGVVAILQLPRELCELRQPAATAGALKSPFNGLQRVARLCNDRCLDCAHTLGLSDRSGVCFSR